MQDNAHTSKVISASARASRTPMCSPAAGPPPPSVIALFNIDSSIQFNLHLLSDLISELRKYEPVVLGDMGGHLQALGRRMPLSPIGQIHRSSIAIRTTGWWPPMLGDFSSPLLDAVGQRAKR